MKFLLVCTFLQQYKSLLYKIFLFQRPEVTLFVICKLQKHILNFFVVYTSGTRGRGRGRATAVDTGLVLPVRGRGTGCHDVVRAGDFPSKTTYTECISVGELVAVAPRSRGRGRLVGYTVVGFIGLDACFVESKHWV